MKKFQKYLSQILALNLLILVTLFQSCERKASPLEHNKIEHPFANDSLPKHKEKIQVLNMGTFHMGFTSDEHKTEFDEHDRENQRKVHEVAKMLAAFKPTVIVVERTPDLDSMMQAEYAAYLQNPDMHFENPMEVELLAYELGRLVSAKRIYGIDHSMEYNYNIGNEIDNKVDKLWHDQFYKDPFSYYPEVNFNENDLSLIEKLRQCNHSAYLDFLMSVNADMLTHVGSEKGFEGADEAAKFYQRNLRMYSNLNRIDLELNDRVFILMGAAHTAFFRDFLNHSPKYEMVNTFDYLGKDSLLH